MSEHGPVLRCGPPRGSSLLPLVRTRAGRYRSSYFDVMREAVEAFGGTAAKFMGDAIFRDLEAGREQALAERIVETLPAR